MNDITRKRIMRKLENLPDEVLYEVVDFIDFVEGRHGTGEVGPSPIQRLAESVEDVLRAGRVPVSALKGTMNVVGTAGRVMDGISAAGQSVLDELQKATTEAASVVSSSQKKGPAEPAGAPGERKEDAEAATDEGKNEDA